MPRLNVWLPVELATTVRANLPSVNVSQVLQEGLRALLGCKHDRIACAACAAELDRGALIDTAKGEYYSQLLWELEDLVAAGGTAEGAARVAKSVALAHQLSAARQPLPRPGRTQQRRNADRRWLERQWRS